MHGLPDPIDPQADAARRDERQRERSAVHLGVACLIGQFFLSLAVGAWAAGIADGGGGEIRLYAAAGMAAALILAYVVANGFRLLAAVLVGVVSLPSWLKRLTSAPANATQAARRQARDQRSERVVDALTLVLHSVVLVAAALLLAGLIAASSAAGYFALCWRFALAAAVLVPLTRRALTVTLP